MLWPFELVVYLIPVGMVSVLNGTIDDGYGGLMGWMWIVASVTTIGLVVATWFALKERSYSAVMAATGLHVPGHPHRLRDGPPAPRAAQLIARAVRDRRPGRAESSPVA